ncbi:MAG: hypothetical protein JKX79_08560 [Labilibaculum sp.]|nr:hypothetical protein [Labilibaculum sp.]
MTATTTNSADFNTINNREAREKTTTSKITTLTQKQRRQTRMSIDAQLERRQLKQELGLTDEEWNNL